MSWPPISDVAKPKLEALYRELAACRVPADKIQETAVRLVRPPVSIGFLTLSEHATGAIEKNFRPFDGDTAARMFRTGAKWKTLTRAERKRSKRLWDWTGRDHALRVTPRGRPAKIDPALVVYCMRVLCEASNRKFRWSRGEDGRPEGPMWRALIEALPLAQKFLAQRFDTLAIARHHIDRHAETVANIVVLTRELTIPAEQVGTSAHTIRLTVARARNSRSRTR